jgi:hypothetical protein
MNFVLEILTALACIANIAMLLFELFDRWRNYTHQQTDEGEKEKPGGHQAS